MTTGLVIGKFMPPHAGHLRLIAAAAARVDRLAVIVFTKAREPIPGALRAAWMRELCPGAAVHHVTEEHRVDFADPAAWELWIGAIRRVLPAGPEFVFSSEGYGDELARRLGARHVRFDRERAAPPLSATMIREAPLAHWEALPPCVRPHYALRVAVVGAESTGKTTLARALAARRATAWVPEYARGYLEERGGTCRPEDLPAIARGQADAEGRLAREADRVLFCDTDLLTTALWSERYFGEVDGEVSRLAADGRYGLTLLCGNDLPWVGDGLRDSPGHREWFRRRFEEELDARGRPWRPVAGTGEARLAAAEAAVDQWCDVQRAGFKPAPTGLRRRTTQGRG